MRRTILVAGLLMLVSVASAQQAAPQPAPPPGAEAQQAPPADETPPLVDETVPAEPVRPEPPRAEAPAAETPAPQSTPQGKLVERTIEYYERLEMAPPEVAAYLADNPVWSVLAYIVRRLSSVLIWLFLFFLIGMGGRKLLRPLFGAPATGPEEARGYTRADRESEGISVPRRVAAADAVAWLVGLAIACEAVGLTWFGAMWSGLMKLLGSLITTAFWLGLLIALAALVAWSFSRYGRRLVLSLLGYYYLQHGPSRPPQGHVFTLPDGREAVILRTDPLHSVMRPADEEETVAVPNADLMERYYSWTAPEPAGKAGERAAN